MDSALESDVRGSFPRSAPEGKGGGMARARRAAFFALGLAALLGVRLAFFLVSVNSFPPTADESISGLLAKGIVQSADSVEFRAKQYPPFFLGRFPLLFMSQPHLFPIDSYLTAPFIHLLPRNAFGARLIPFAMGTLAAAGCLALLLRSWNWRRAWPAALLVLFPSAYLLAFTAGCVLPVYPTFIFLATAAALTAYGRKGDAARGWLWALLSGFLAGLCVSVSLLGVPVLLFAGAFAALRTRKGAVAAAAAYAAGAAAGFAPFLVAKAVYPGAYAEVSGLRQASDILRRMWSPALDFTLPSALGIRVCIFPDSAEGVSLVPGMEKIAGMTWLVLLLSATALGAWRFVRRLAAEKWPSLETGDVFAAVSWMALAMHAANARAHHHDYRYLLLAVWAFPFVAARAAEIPFRFFKMAAAAVAVAFAVLNLGTSALLLKEWARPGFARDKVFLHDARPVVEELSRRGISRCYATYWNAYRIAFASDERIICGQPYNECSPGWPIPYRDEVDRSTNAAVALSPGFRFLPAPFDNDLLKMGVQCERTECGEFVLYSDFRRPAAPVEKIIDRAGISVSASHCSAESFALTDGNWTNRWRTREAQKEGMWVQLLLSERRPVGRVTMCYDGYPHDMASAVSVLTRDDAGEWAPAAARVSAELDPFDFRNGHPVFGHEIRTIRFGPAITDAVRIEIVEVNPGRDWTIGEIEIYESADGPSGSGH